MVAVNVLALPDWTPTNVAVYVPGVLVLVTVPNEPVLVPPARVNPNALFARPVIAFPAASSATMVTVSFAPEVTDEEAKLTVELLALTDPEAPTRVDTSLFAMGLPSPVAKS